LPPGDPRHRRGVHPVIGRGFLPDEDVPGGGKPVCVLSYNFWRHRFQSEPNVAGKGMQINGHAFTIVGVAPQGFIGTRLLSFVPDVWIPAAMQPVIAPGFGDYLQSRDNRWLELRGRLRDPVSPKSRPRQR